MRKKRLSPRILWHELCGQWGRGGRKDRRRRFLTALRDALVEGSADLVTRALERQMVSPQMSLLVPRGTELLLRFIPAIIAGSSTQGQHRIDVGGSEIASRLL
jgi:hypothetical protein